MKPYGLEGEVLNTSTATNVVRVAVDISQHERYFLIREAGLNGNVRVVSSSGEERSFLSVIDPDFQKSAASIMFAIEDARHVSGVLKALENVCPKATFHSASPKLITSAFGVSSHTLSCRFHPGATG